MSKPNFIDVSRATLDLFKKLPFNKEGNMEQNANEMFVETAPNGYVYSEEALTNSFLGEFLVQNMVDKKFSKSTKEFNKTFFGIEDVSEMDDMEFYLKQMFHYITATMSDIGWINQEDIYIPENSIKDKNDEFIPHAYHLTVVGVIKEDEIKERVEKLLYSGVALKSSTVEQIFVLSDYYDFTDKIDIESVKNKEARIALYKKTGKVPSNPIEFVRYAFYLATGLSMMVKNSGTYQFMNSARRYNDKAMADVTSAMNTYVNANGYEPLASVFYRYKKIFILMKNGHEGMNYHINRIRRLADTYKKAPKVGILDRLNEIGKDEFDVFKKEFDKQSVFKKVALLNYGLSTMQGQNDRVYFIRNGKMFFRKDAHVKPIAKKILGYMTKSIVLDVKPIVQGKKVYIPAEMDYAFPVSEKKFVGGIPFNSKFTLDRTGDTFIGIHWLNWDNGTKHGERTDLDLHVTNINGERLGWNSYFRDGYGTTFFTGDLTDAPRNSGGSSEIMYFTKEAQNTMYSVTVNNFSNNHNDFPYELLVAKSAKKLNPNSDKMAYADHVSKKAVAGGSDEFIKVNNILGGGENNIGYFRLNDDTVDFYFTDMQMSNCRVPHEVDFDVRLTNYMETYMNSVVRLKDILNLCDVEFVETPTEDCVNLDYCELGNTTILDFLCKKEDK